MMTLSEARKQLKRIEAATGGWGDVVYLKGGFWQETAGEDYGIWLPDTTGMGGEYTTLADVEQLLEALKARKKNP